MDQILEKLKNKQNLTFEESKSAFEILMTGKATDEQIYNFLTLLSEKGEVSEEIAGGDDTAASSATSQLDTAIADLDPSRKLSVYESFVRSV